MILKDTPQSGTAGRQVRIENVETKTLLSIDVDLPQATVKTIIIA